MSTIKKLAVGLGLLGLIIALTGLGFIWWIGAWGILFPSDAYETQPPEIASDFGQESALSLLVYSKTNSFRHKEGIEAAHALFDQIGARRGWAVFHSENSAIFDPALLSRFDIIVFASASGNHASDQQDAAFARWLEQGGGWVGIHAAGDGSHAAWRWYVDTLIGADYLGHILGPQTQQARVVVEARNHPVTRGLPAEFLHEEEWYSWDRSPREAGFEVLLSVDETTYEPFIRGFGAEKDIRMTDHPIVWARCVGRGRALYTALGHWAAAYRSEHYPLLLENAVEWTAGKGGASCPDAVTTP